MADNTVEWRDQTPVSTEFDDVYYSADDGLAESRYVFLSHNNLPNAWQDSPRFTILETGFGTGLNFCATSVLWQQQRNNKQTLHFVSIEKYPLQQQQIKRALSRWPELNAISDELCRLLPPPLAGWHHLYLPQRNIELTLIYDDVKTALKNIENNNIRANAIFLDGFAPAKNPDMWADEVLNQLAKCAEKNATLATFTAVGRVRRTLQSAGFTMQKNQGFGSKREMLVGTYTKAEQENIKAWHKLAPAPTPKNVAIIGAGIAGCIMAHKLAARGLKVRVFEQASQAANGASGNSQGVLFIKLSAGNGILSDYSSAAFLYAHRFYQQLLDQNIIDKAAVQLSGMLQLLSDDNWTTLKHHYSNTPEFAHFVDAAEASIIAGTRITQKAVFFPDSGHISPVLLCNQLLSHPNIQLYADTAIQAISPQADHCLLHTANDSIQADALVLATANDSQALVNTMALPIKPAPGQVTQFEATAAHDQLNCAICHEGYIAPPQNGEVCIGATFRMKAPHTDISEQDNLVNISRYKAAFPDLAAPNTYSAKVSSRAASGDYLPLAGPLPNTAKFNQDFAQLGHNAKQQINLNGCYVPNVFILAGLGSRGLSYAPLAADLICQQLLNEAQLLAPTIAQALNPARFVIRALKRGTSDALL